MIVYRKAFMGIGLLFRLYGSAIVRCSFWVVLAGAETALLYVLLSDHQSSFFWNSGYATYTIFSAMLALLVIFRQNAGYGRFHEGRIRLQAMTAAYLEACTDALTFDGGSKTFAPPDAASMRFRLDCIHTFSLLHALSLQFLRSDWLLENLTEHDPAKLPPWDSGNDPSWHPQLTDYFVLRAVSTRRLPYNAAHPIPVIGPLSPHEKAALMQAERVPTLNGDQWDGALKKLGAWRSFRHHVFASSQGKYVRGAAERVYKVYYWLHERMRQRMTEGGLDMPAPILAQMYGAMQRGMDSFEHCRYLCDTPFPFSWAQMLMVMLLCFQFTSPFVFVSAIRSIALGIISCMISVLAFWALNEVSRELEDPFCFEPNDIPLARLQYQFNERLLATVNTKLPVSTRLDLDVFHTQLRDAVRRAARGSLGAPDAALSSEDAEAPAVVSRFDRLDTLASVKSEGVGDEAV